MIKELQKAQADIKDLTAAILSFSDKIAHGGSVGHQGKEIQSDEEKRKASQEERLRAQQEHKEQEEKKSKVHPKRLVADEHKQWQKLRPILSKNPSMDKLFTDPQKAKYAHEIFLELVLLSNTGGIVMIKKALDMMSISKASETNETIAQQQIKASSGLKNMTMQEMTEWNKFKPILGKTSILMKYFTDPAKAKFGRSIFGELAKLDPSTRITLVKQAIAVLLKQKKALAPQETVKSDGTAKPGKVGVKTDNLKNGNSSSKKTLGAKPLMLHPQVYSTETKARAAAADPAWAAILGKIHDLF